jgi:hypothetical protein
MPERRTEMNNTLTTHELWSLAELAWAYADRNDDDDEIFEEYSALHEKLVEMAKQSDPRFQGEVK